MSSAPPSRRAATLIAAIGSVVAIAVITVVLVTSHGSPPTTHACPILAGPTLTHTTLATTGTIATPGPAALPPSHDNDAGHSRILDSTPDADADASQVATGCTRQ
ncbi:MAG: hypothetical protein ACP5PB_05275 [Acidimicrobiales bacterium]